MREREQYRTERDIEMVADRTRGGRGKIEIGREMTRERMGGKCEKDTN